MFLSGEKQGKIRKFMYKFDILNPNPDSDVKFFADPDPKQTCQCITGYAGTIRLSD
jgi:hypothetical protein